MFSVLHVRQARCRYSQKNFKFKKGNVKKYNDVAADQHKDVQG